MNTWRAWSIAAVATTKVACGAYTVPAQHVTNARSAIAAAEHSGAATNAAASVHLKLAQDQYASAEGLIRVGDERQADLLLLQSQADAQLARSLAREAAATAAAAAETEQAARQIRQLGEGMQQAEVKEGVKP